MTDLEQDLFSAHKAYCNKGYEMLCEYRLNNVYDIDLRQWFKQRAGCDEAWEALESMKLVRDTGKYGDVLHVLIYDDPKPYMSICVTDAYFNEACTHIDAKLSFKSRELWTRKYGLWAELASYDGGNPDHYYRRKADPLYGRVCLLPGSHYFEMNYFKLVDGETRQQVAPNFNRKSCQIIDILEILSGYDYKSGIGREGVWFFKPRAVKFTSDSNAFLINKMFTPDIYRIGSTIDATIKTESALKEKVADPIKTLPEWVLDDFSKKNEKLERSFKIERYTNNDSQIWIQYTTPDGKSIPSYYMVKGAIPKGLEQWRLECYFADEINKYEYPISATIENARACLLNKNRECSGLFIGGGTSDGLNRNAEQVQRIAMHPIAHKLFTIFIGQQYHRYVNPETGWGDPERAVREELEARKLLEETGGIETLVKKLENDAICLEDCFYESGESMLDKVRINAQLTKIRNEEAVGTLNIQEGFLHPTWEELKNPTAKIDGRLIDRNHIQNPIFKPTQEGRGGWFIFKHPDKGLRKEYGRMGRDYFSGSDNINMILSVEEANKVRQGNTKMSLCCMVVMNVHTFEPVAMYRYRHDNPRADYLQMMLGSFYYNCYNLIETNKEGQLNFNLEDSLFNKIIPGEFARMILYPTPQLLKSRNSKQEFGINTGVKKQEHYKNHIVPYFQAHTEDIWFKDILSACARWDIESLKNTPDEGMATMNCIIGLDDMLRNPRMTNTRTVNPYKEYGQLLNRMNLLKQMKSGGNLRDLL